MVFSGTPSSVQIIYKLGTASEILAQGKNCTTQSTDPWRCLRAVI